MAKKQHILASLRKAEQNIFVPSGLATGVFEELPQISACKNKIAKAKAYYNKLCSELQALQEERELVMSQKILAAMKQSGRSYDELMTFLQVPKA